jgi:hypothetical protein
MFRRIHALARSLSWGAACAALIGCGGGSGARANEPPSGAVDLEPGVALAEPGAEPPERNAPRPPRQPKASAVAEKADDDDDEEDAPAAEEEPAPEESEDTAPPDPKGKKPKAGEIVMTREHCATLGRKFAELAKTQASIMPGIDPARIKTEANKIGKDFANKCNRDMVGETVPKAEYDCMIRAKAHTDILGCKQ